MGESGDPVAAFAWRRGHPRAPSWVARLLGVYLPRLEQRIGHRLLRDPKTGDLWPPLGCGVYGCVLALEDATQVLKITSDDEEGPLSAHVQRLQEARLRTTVGPFVQATAIVQRVLRFPKMIKVKGVELQPYAIVREAVDVKTRIDLRLTEVADLYTDGWEMHCFGKTAPQRTMGELMARGALITLAKQGADGKRIAAALTELWRQGAPLMDAHRQNLAVRMVPGPDGAKPGQVIVFEYGVSRLCPVLPAEIGSLDDDGMLSGFETPPLPPEVP